MTRLLSLFGLMRVSEHEAREMKSAADDQLIAQLTRTCRRLHMLIECRDAEIAALRPDALAMRRKRQMDRNRRKGNG